MNEVHLRHGRDWCGAGAPDGRPSPREDPPQGPIWTRFGSHTPLWKTGLIAIKRERLWKKLRDMEFPEPLIAICEKAFETFGWEEMMANKQN